MSYDYDVVIPKIVEPVWEKYMPYDGNINACNGHINAWNEAVRNAGSGSARLQLNFALTFAASVEQALLDGETLSKELLVNIWEEQNSSNTSFLIVMSASMVLLYHWTRYNDLKEQGFLPEDMVWD